MNSLRHVFAFVILLSLVSCQAHKQLENAYWNSHNCILYEKVSMSASNRTDKLAVCTSGSFQIIFEKRTIERQLGGDIQYIKKAEPSVQLGKPQKDQISLNDLALQKGNTTLIPENDLAPSVWDRASFYVLLGIIQTLFSLIPLFTIGSPYATDSQLAQAAAALVLFGLSIFVLGIIGFVKLFKRPPVRNKERNLQDRTRDNNNGYSNSNNQHPIHRSNRSSESFIFSLLRILGKILIGIVLFVQIWVGVGLVVGGVSLLL